MRRLVALLVLAAPPTAHAASLRLSTSVDGAVEVVSSAPNGKFTASNLETAPRTLSSTPVRAVEGPLTFLSVGGDLSAVLGERWIFSLVGARVGGAIGPYAASLRSADGSPLRVRPWSAWHADVTALGLRYRANLRRWSVGVGAAFGVAVLVMPADAAYGAETIKGNVVTPSWTLQASLEGCRRMDPTTRACLVVTPYLHQYGWFDGGALALRWEVQ